MTFILNVVDSNVLDTILTWYDDIAYHFSWGFDKDNLGYFNPKVCSMDKQTFYFGSRGISSKWGYGLVAIANYAVAIHDFGAVKQSVLRLFGQGEWDKLSIKSVLADLESGGSGNLPNFVGNLKGVGYPAYRFISDRQYVLMVGSDYMEPCRWEAKVPKLVEYGFTSHPSVLGVHEGAFDFHLLSGLNCGRGRFSGWFDDNIAAMTEEQLEIAKQIDKTKKDDPDSSALWLSFKELKKSLIEGTPSMVDFSNNPPLETLTDGGFATLAKQNKDYVRTMRYYTSGMLLDPSTKLMTVCGVFTCKNAAMVCKVHLDRFIVSDISGELSSPWEDTPFYGLTPLDIFTVFMMVFCVLFFLVQCFCCCQICVMEINAGVIDEKALFEMKLKQDYNTRMAPTQVAKGRARRRRSRRMSSRRNSGGKSPRRKSGSRSRRRRRS